MKKLKRNWENIWYSKNFSKIIGKAAIKETREIIYLLGVAYNFSYPSEVSIKHYTTNKGEFKPEELIIGKSKIRELIIKEILESK